MQKSDWTWQSSDGLIMVAHTWAPARPPKAVVCLMHGLGEHFGRYGHVAAALNAAGYVLLGYDQRGHGRSQGQRGHAPSYEQLMDDVSSFIAQARQRHPGLPVFLYGHSMGGNMVINFALRNRPELAGVVATSPWLRLTTEPPAARVTLAMLMNSVSPEYAQASGLEQASISRVPAVVQAYADDPLVHDQISARLFVILHRSGQWALRHAAEFPLPMLLMHGSADRLTSYAGSQEFASSAGSKVTLRLWEGGYHELHNDVEQTQVIKTIVDWLDAHTPA